MKDIEIEVRYNHINKRLVILKDGKAVGGYCGEIATRMMRRIAFNNAKVEVIDGNVQVGV
jgi:hypothetical protein